MKVKFRVRKPLALVLMLFAWLSCLNTLAQTAVDSVFKLNDFNNGNIDTLNLCDSIGLDFDTDFDVSLVTYARQMPENTNWGTLCLPFDFDASDCNDDLQFFEIEYINNDGFAIRQLTEVKAGQAVLFFKPTSDSLKISKENVTIKDTIMVEADQLVGSYKKHTLDYGFYLKDNTFKNCYHYPIEDEHGVVLTPEKQTSFVLLPFHGFANGNGYYGANDLKFFLPENKDEELVEDSVKEKTIDGIFNVSGQRVGKLSNNGVYIIRFTDGSVQKVKVQE